MALGVWDEEGSSVMHGWREKTGMIYWPGWEINDGADGGVNEWKG